VTRQFIGFTAMIRDTGGGESPHRWARSLPQCDPDAANATQKLSSRFVRSRWLQPCGWFRLWVVDGMFASYRRPQWRCEIN